MLSPLQAQRQCARTSYRKKCLECARRSSSEFARVTEGRQRIRVSQRRDASQQIGMAADEFRDGLHRDIRAEQERLLIERRGEGVVHSENRAMFSRRGTDRVDVADRQERIRR